ncbi:hypothetical protein CH330_02305 [candidate division WOR-3 bacterium JGI_Cruoil_03_51_56]|uniref:DUF763 domain-containing protein n=1 Tax=candidate division WOR-3 bacterium JGI_Cruoil_03_51_56 TaxID=1973747 RepID=A0A235BWS4_UNCW3|nr:MAG: hypothetical protein CH330_02305 [candidate division WOR-3 bacterium JGI_Cruoil_03_51_56]
MRSGFADLPLHWGAAPHWFFDRMVKLGRAITEIIVTDYGVDELLRRVSDPVWFQSLGCVLGFDWHSSGITTTVCGALKEGIKGYERNLGLYICGGKGKASHKTPEEIRRFSDLLGLDGEQLVKASRMSAKVDSAGLQDGFQIYHHVFFGTAKGKWAVVQQGMNTKTGWARRYHWLSMGLRDFVVEPHSGIACDHKTKPLNMVAIEANDSRNAVVELARERPETTTKELKFIRSLKLPGHHPIFPADISLRYLDKVLVKTYENPPDDFKELLLTPGVGPKTIRALALIGDVTHGAKPSFRDPVTYSFALGGKDGYPYPVNRTEYDRAISVLERGIKEAKLGRQEKLRALRRLERYYQE